MSSKTIPTKNYGKLFIADRFKETMKESLNILEQIKNEICSMLTCDGTT